MSCVSHLSHSFDGFFIDLGKISKQTISTKLPTFLPANQTTLLIHLSPSGAIWLLSVTI